MGSPYPRVPSWKRFTIQMASGGGTSGKKDVDKQTFNAIHFSNSVEDGGSRDREVGFGQGDLAEAIR